MTNIYSAHAKRVREVLRDPALKHASIFSPSVFAREPYRFDFTEKNSAVSAIDMRDPDAFSRYIAGTLQQNGRMLGIGKYGEDRVIYRQSQLFQDGNEARSVHLGIDLFVQPGTAVNAPLDGWIHSFRDNDFFLDYGPTILLAHNIQGVNFFTLYGHLSRASLPPLHVGQLIEQGERIAWIGEHDENGSWAPHLHFQIIVDLMGKVGDFPGVARPSEQDAYLERCPDPNLILRLDHPVVALDHAALP